MKRVGLVLGVVVLVAGAVLVKRLQPGVALAVGAGYAARVTCSLAFHSGMDPEWVMRRYVSYDLGPAHALVKVSVDREAGTVDAVAAGLARARAIYRDGIGCTLVADADEAELRRFRDPPHAPPLASDVPWPGGESPITTPPPPALVAAIEEAFTEPHADADPPRQTSAVLVAHRGRLIAERYAPGIGPDTPLLSWSSAKSVIAALVGVAVREGRIDLHAPAPVPEWRDAGDPRGAITVDQLLRMSSGLAFDETYGAVNDVSRMLFTRADAGAFAAGFPPAGPPDSRWSYSSGTSNILARIVRDALGRDLESMVSWSRRAFFDPVGMRSAVFETDASGSFIGSSLFFATGRDWARFGQLHLQDGVWEGRRILPEGWSRYVSTPTPKASHGGYGAGWWLNAGDPDDPTQRMWPSVPREVYSARGKSGQYVVVVPSAELVIVRLGLTQGLDESLDGIEPLVRAVLDVLAPRS
jgi:hypothetical protein